MPYRHAAHRHFDRTVVFPWLYRWHPTPLRAIQRHMARERAWRGWL